MQKKYLERIKGGAIGVSSPKFYNLSLSTLAKFEDYFTASFEESIYLDKGTLNTAIISLALDSVTETKIIQNKV